MAGLDSAVIENLRKSEFGEAIESFMNERGRPPSTQELRQIPALRRGLDTIERESKGGKADATLGYGYGNYPYVSAALSPGCREECKDCRSQWLVGLIADISGYQTCYTDAEAQERLDEMRETIKQHHDQLLDLVHGHGDAIVRRWQKRTVAKRAAMIRNLLPDMYGRRGFPLVEWVSLRPEIKFQEDVDRMRSLRTPSLLPYCSIESLSEDPTAMIALLYHRANHSPMAWSSFDEYQHHYLFSFGMLRAPYNPHCVLTYGTHYGRLVSWHKARFHRGDVAGFPRVYLMLEAQTILYGFLHKLANTLVGETKNEAADGSQKLQGLAATGFARGSGWVTDELSHNSPFCAPPHFDIDLLVDAFRARLRASADELELLQTDPHYLRAHLLTAEGSVQLTHATTSEKPAHLVTLVILRLVKHDDWVYLVSEAEAARNVLHNKRHQVSSGAPLLAEYDATLSILEQALKEQFGAQQKHLGETLCSSKSFAHLVNKRSDGKFEARGTRRKTLSEDPLFYHITELMRYSDAVSGVHASDLFRGLDHLLSRTSIKDASRVDRLMYTIITDMVMVDKALTTIKLHRPRCRPSRDTFHGSGISTEESMLETMAGDPSGEDSPAQAYMKRMSKVVATDFMHTQAVKDGYKDLVQPLSKFMSTKMPSGRNTKEALDAFDRAHEALQEFWAAVRRWRTKSLRDTGLLSATDVEQQMKCVSYSSSREYMQSVTEERMTLVSAIAVKEEVNTARKQEARSKLQSTVLPQTTWGNDAQNVQIEAGRIGKEKIKTKSTSTVAAGPAAQDAADVAVNGELSALHISRKIRLSRENVRLLSRMFPSSDNSKVSKSNVKWDDLVAAMIDAGFAVTANGGSAITFKQTDGTGSIVFHRPHPEPVVDPIMLRAMGKRLAKWFGWERESFVERGED